jgi:exodeoxyribonuclease VII large subunit
LLVPDRTALSARLDAYHRRLANLQQHGLRERTQRTDRAFLRLQALRPQARLAALAQRAQQAHVRLANAMQRRLERDRASLRNANSVLGASHPRRRIERLRARLASLQGRPQILMASRLQHDALRLRGLARSLHAISPLATVARGYSILQHDDGRIVRGVGDAAVGDMLDARLHDGHLQVQVRGKH